MKNLTTVLLGLLCVASPALCGTPTVVPEPASIILFGTVAAAIGGFAWYKGRTKGR
jgi:hypothetical protein